LVLDADGLAAELVGDAQCGDVELTLGEDLGFGELGRGVFAKVEFEALFLEPSVNGVGFGVADLGGFVVERGLGEA